MDKMEAGAYHSLSNWSSSVKAVCVNSERFSSKPVFTDSGQNVRRVIVQRRAGLHKASPEDSKSAVCC